MVEVVSSFDTGGGIVVGTYTGLQEHDIEEEEEEEEEEDVLETIEGTLCVLLADTETWCISTVFSISVI